MLDLADFGGRGTLNLAPYTTWLPGRKNDSSFQSTTNVWVYDWVNQELLRNGNRETTMTGAMIWGLSDGVSWNLAKDLSLRLFN